ncbi:MAG TPA: holo-ACP synthase, partial [Burkholderiales bacterium]|nr:holo-ACP synthase [Burkholderiales bacterium]
RVAAALARHGDRFAHRILVAREYERFAAHRKPAAYLAKRFAAKEAFSKAMGTGIRAPVNWHNIGVVNHASGRPYLELSAVLADLVRRRGISNVHVSITDERGIAAAFVVLEGAPGDG